jgi:hypothetical protein
MNSFYFHDRFMFFVEAHHASAHRCKTFSLVAAVAHPVLRFPSTMLSGAAAFRGLLFGRRRSSSCTIVSFIAVIRCRRDQVTGIESSASRAKIECRPCSVCIGSLRSSSPGLICNRIDSVNPTRSAHSDGLDRLRPILS